MSDIFFGSVASDLVIVSEVEALSDLNTEKKPLSSLKLAGKACKCWRKDVSAVFCLIISVYNRSLEGGDKAWIWSRI